MHRNTGLQMILNIGLKHNTIMNDMLVKTGSANCGVSLCSAWIKLLAEKLTV
jgi:hypothetical protein